MQNIWIASMSNTGPRFELDLDDSKHWAVLVSTVAERRAHLDCSERC